MVERSRVLQSWGGAFSDYDDFKGVRIPRTGKAYWYLPEGRFEYWRGEVTRVDLQPSVGLLSTRWED